MLPPSIKPIAEWAATGLELAGIAIIVLVGVAATLIAIRNSLGKHHDWHTIFHTYRLMFSRGILLGLEFLVAADIIQSVAIEISWSSVGVLAVIVLIRTFLSFTLEVEISGRWPWQQRSGR